MATTKRQGSAGRPFLGDKKKSQLRAIRMSPELCAEIERRRGDLSFGTFHRECLILGLKHWPVDDTAVSDTLSE